MTRPQSAKTANSLSELDGTPLPAVVVGIGSPHGQDVAGWEVIDALERWLRSAGGGQSLARVSIQKAVVPHDVLDWLVGDACVHLIDASLDTTPGVRRFLVETRHDGSLRLTDSDVTCEHADRVGFPNTRSRSSHHFDLANVLQLAAALGRMPPRLVLWTITIESTDKRQPLSLATQQRIDLCAQRIASELSC